MENFIWYYLINISHCLLSFVNKIDSIYLSIKSTTLRDLYCTSHLWVLLHFYFSKAKRFYRPSHFILAWGFAFSFLQHSIGFLYGITPSRLVCPCCSSSDYLYFVAKLSSFSKVYPSFRFLIFDCIHDYN